MSRARRLSSLSIKEKEDIIKERKSIKNGRKVSEVLEEIKRNFGLEKIPSKSWLYQLKAEEDKRKNKQGDVPEIEQYLIEWMKTCQETGTPCHGYVLEEIGKEYRDKRVKEDDLKEEDRERLKNFRFSSGWLSGFKRRHEIKGIEIHGDANKVDTEKCREEIERIKNIIKNYIKFYGIDSVYNADETGLFAHQLGKKTLASRRESIALCDEKSRYSVLLCCNINGSDKKPPIIIGKSVKPHGYSQKLAKDNNVIYKSQKSSWMDTEIFQDFLRNWDVELDKEVDEKKKNILLVVDNCPSHSLKTKNDDGTISTLELKHIQLLFLPPGVTSVYQPLDMGIIWSFKCNYKKLLLKDLCSQITLYNENKTKENKEKVKKIKNPATVQCLKYIGKCWQNVTKTTISNCWAKSELVDNNIIDRNEKDVATKKK